MVEAQSLLANPHKIASKTGLHFECIIFTMETPSQYLASETLSRATEKYPNIIPKSWYA